MGKSWIKSDFGLVFWMHIFFIVSYYGCSWFLFDWKIVLLIAALLYLQYSLLPNCFLTKFQTNETRSFYHYYLSKMGIRTDRRKVAFVSHWVLPFFVSALSIFWQVLLPHNPLIKLF